MMSRALADEGVVATATTLNGRRARSCVSHRIFRDAGGHAGRPHAHTRTRMRHCKMTPMAYVGISHPRFRSTEW
jgi:hypothetical protein